MEEMVRVSQSQKNKLEEAGLLKYRKVSNGIEIESPNFVVANREHKSRSKTYYVAEEYKILKFLGLLRHKRNKTKKGHS